jgi:hypothetical protein
MLHTDAKIDPRLVDVRCLTPKVEGVEIVDLSESGATAYAGTGFNWDNEQHMRGSDAARYAIALQQIRDRGDYAECDRARVLVEYLGNQVMQGRGFTRVKSTPAGLGSRQSKKGRELLAAYKMQVVDGILYDGSLTANNWNRWAGYASH